MFLHNLWSSPARIIAGMWLLFNELESAVFVGVLLLVAMTPIQIRVMGKIAGLMRRNFKEADARIKAMNEIL